MFGDLTGGPFRDNPRSQETNSGRSVSSVPHVPDSNIQTTELNELSLGSKILTTPLEANISIEDPSRAEQIIDNDTFSSMEVTPGFSGNVLTAAKAFITSPGMFAGTGSAIVTFPISWEASAIFTCSALLTGINEARHALLRTKTQKAEALSDECALPNEPSKGYLALFKEKVFSPALSSLIQAGSFVFSSTRAFSQGLKFDGIVHAGFAAALFGVARIANLSAVFPPREKTSIEKFAQHVWNFVPNRIQIVLKDPGVGFCLGNIALIAKSVDFTKFQGNMPMAALFCAGVAVAGVGVARGLSPLVTGRESKKSGLSQTLGGIGDLALGTVTISIFQSPFVGAATLFWGVSNILFGERNGSGFLKAIRNKILPS